jgi:hypothetical protein
MSNFNWSNVSPNSAYVASSREHREALAHNLRVTLRALGFSPAGETRGTHEEVWSKQTARNGRNAEIKVFTSIDARYGQIRGHGADQIRFASPGFLSSKPRNGEKGFTVKRTGKFQNILDRVIREAIRATDAALTRACEKPADPVPADIEQALRMALIARMEDLKQIPHPAQWARNKGQSMWDYVAYMLQTGDNAKMARAHSAMTESL